MDLKMRNSKMISNKLIAAVILITILIFNTTGCQKEEVTPEPPSNAESSYNCDVRQGFINNFSPSEADSIREDIKNVENQIKEIQGMITSKKSELNSMESTNKSEAIQSLESKIASLESEIKSLQEQIVSLQNDIKVLQSSEKSEEVKSLENEINNYQAQVISLQNNLRGLQSDLSDVSTYSEQAIIGYVEYLKIGDTELTSDLSVIDPISLSQQKVVGVMSTVNWRGSYADPIEFSCQISKSNKNASLEFIHSVSSNTEVEFVLSVYDYDPTTKSYYKCFHTNSVALYGLVYKSAGEMALYIDMDQSAEVTDPNNFRFALGVMPQDIDQEVHLAVSSEDKFIKRWGITIN